MVKIFNKDISPQKDAQHHSSLRDCKLKPHRNTTKYLKYLLKMVKFNRIPCQVWGKATEGMELSYSVGRNIRVQPL